MSPPPHGGPRADITVYRWSERSLTGRGDVGPVTTSLDREALLRWNSRIENMVWATQEHPGDTAPGFVYLRYGPEAAVLRKVPVRDPHGRAGSTLTHVLTGPATGIDLPSRSPRAAATGTTGCPRRSARTPSSTGTHRRSPPRSRRSGSPWTWSADCSWRRSGSSTPSTRPPPTSPTSSSSGSPRR